MKYLKKFENTIIRKYKEGDFVKVLAKGVLSDKTRAFVDSHIGKISDVGSGVDDAYPYTISFPENLPDKKISEFVFTDEEIVRLATPEEIKEYNMKKDASKYNL